MNKRELAWIWFIEKYGLVLDWDFDGDIIEIESCGDSYKIIFDARKSHMDGKKLFIDRDPLNEIGQALSGELDGEHDRPFLDELSDALFNMIRKFVVNDGGAIVWKRFWRNGSFSLCLTHDVDEIRKTYQFVTRSARFIMRRDFGSLIREIIALVDKLRGKDPYWTFDRIMEIEDRLGVRSSFYFLREKGKVKLRRRKSWRNIGRRYEFTDVEDVMKNLVDGGWDVGLHGSFDSYMDENLLKSEKEELEKVLGDRIVGIRQHNLNLSIPKTWRIQERLGFEYDTTLGSNKDLSFRWGTCFPFYPIDNCRFSKVLQIPLIVEDIVLMRKERPWNELLRMIEIVKRHGGVLTILWHHSVFGRDYPGWDEIYEKLIVHCKNEGAWVCSGKQILEWWKFRNKSKVFLDLGSKRIDIFSEVPIVIDSGGRYVVRESWEGRVGRYIWEE